MFYVLEFFSLVDGLEKQRLKAITHQAQSADDAVRYAKAFLKYVAVQDKRPNYCLVKYQNGKVISVVSNEILPSSR